jgi:hypothetical protein
MSMDELANVKGRGWEDIDVSSMLRGLLLEVEANHDHSIKQQHRRKDL